MNVLVYSGPGSTTESVKHCIESLRYLLSPHYAVVSVGEASLLNDPWMYKTAMLVIPGGADLPYCRSLNGAGTRKIAQYVKKGGKYLGFCAGAYFASGRVEFEVGHPLLEVTGDRELQFFPGIARGCTFKGFDYKSHAGARAPKVCIEGTTDKVYAYYNGGGVFVDASKYRGVEVIARYEEPIDLEDEEKVAVIYKKVGRGDVLLSGIHPEYSPDLLKPESEEFNKTIEILKQHDHERKVFLRNCLAKLGLKVNEDVEAQIPHLTPIYVSSHLDTSLVNKLAENLKNNVDLVNNSTLEDDNDTLVFHGEDEDEHHYLLSDDTISSEDYTSAPKHIKIFNNGGLPDSKSTPYFNMASYFSQLQALCKGNNCEIGSVLGYGEVVTSTSTLLDHNPKFLSQLPHGFIITATEQVAGRGRGGNVWVNPKGVMASSILFKVPSKGGPSTNIVTLQYLLVLALIEAILGYGSYERGSGAGYEDIPVRLKWPNDIYILKPEFFNNLEDGKTVSSTVEGDDEKYAKVSGALVNSQYIDGNFNLVWGGGVNVSNDEPTTSLNSVLKKLNIIRVARGLPELPPYQPEKLLAKMVFTMDQFYNVFKTSGLRPFLPLYYKRWFHTNQQVSLDAKGDGHIRSCIIRGITDDYGLLIAEDQNSREILHLQPDGNSFDIFKGLVYKKQ
ncbi:biotin holocarboxylase synthetase [Scheffersomyces amazonensis]|uniref:biotin holocarboxylase synthetase n=1 Tax=Scheffersomyces amazonensis TaxID=1078765 RepID=UPI00315CAF09